MCSRRVCCVSMCRQQSGIIHVYTHTCSVLTNDYRPWFGAKSTSHRYDNKICIFRLFCSRMSDNSPGLPRWRWWIRGGSYRPACIVHNLCAHVHPSNFTSFAIIGRTLHPVRANAHTCSKIASASRHQHPRTVRVQPSSSGHHRQSAPPLNLTCMRECVCTVACVCSRCVNIIVYTSHRISRVLTHTQHHITHTCAYGRRPTHVRAFYVDSRRAHDSVHI